MAKLGGVIVEIVGKDKVFPAMQKGRKSTGKVNAVMGFLGGRIIGESIHAKNLRKRGI